MWKFIFFAVALLVFIDLHCVAGKCGSITNLSRKDIKNLFIGDPSADASALADRDKRMSSHHRSSSNCKGGKCESSGHKKKRRCHGSKCCKGTKNLLDFSKIIF